jgi:pilus assembly protein CpaE
VLQNVHRLDPQYVERTLVAKSNRLFVLSAELDYGTRSTLQPGAMERILSLLCDGFHYVILDVGSAVGTLAEEAFDGATRAYLVADRSVHSTRETVRRLKYIEDRDNDMQTSLLLNNPNAATAGKVQFADFVTAVGRAVLHEVPFEPKAVSISENLGEAPKEKTGNGFNHSVTRIADDLTGQQTVTVRSLLHRLGVRKG